MSLSKQLEKFNKQQAYPMRPYLSLEQILENLDLQALQSLAQDLGLRTGKRPVRKKMVSSIGKHILDPKRIEQALLIIDQNEYNLFVQLLEKDYIQNNLLSLWVYLFMMEQKILFSFLDKGKVFFVIPREIKTIYRSLDKKQFDPKRARYQLVHRYLSALSNLYGFFEGCRLVEIFNYHNREKLSMEESRTISGHLCSKFQSYYRFEEFIICDYFEEDNMEELDDLIKQTMDLPYYLPTKEEILLWHEGGFKMTPQLCALLDYLVQDMGLSIAMAELLVEDIDVLGEMEQPIQEVIHEFEKRDIYFTHRAQLEAVLPLIVDIYNHTRVWANRGHTYAEIIKLTPRSIPNRFTRPIEASIQGKKVILKVAKHDLCFCGSGKQYVHCCRS